MPLTQAQPRSKALFQLLSIERNSHHPVLSLLLDSYLRDRLASFQKNPLNLLLSLEDWAHKFPTLHTISSHNKQLSTMALSTMETYMKRYCQPMVFPASNKIQETVGLINTILNTILNNQLETPPFQIDLVIIPQNPRTQLGNSDQDADNEDEDADEFDEEEEYTHSAETLKHSRSANCKAKMGKRAFRYSKKGKLAHKTYRNNKKKYTYHRW